MADVLCSEVPSTDIMAMPALPMTNVLSPSTLVPLFEDDDSRWCAVQTRNPSADGFFIYAVRSTKIYCRPICKARLARRANVSFFTLPSEARNAGFRACKRCKPDEKGSMPEEKAVRRIREFVRTGGEGGSLAQMARRSGLSKWHFHRVFKRTVGSTPVEYVRMKRKGQVFDPSFGAANLTYESESPATGSGDSLDWLQEMEGKDFDLDELDFLLEGDTQSLETTLQEPQEDGGFEGGMSWIDLLAWPEDSHPAPT